MRINQLIPRHAIAIRDVRSHASRTPERYVLPLRGPSAPPCVLASIPEYDLAAGRALAAGKDHWYG